MSGTAEGDANGRRLQDLYWKLLVQLKVDCEYIRRYQASLDRTITTVAAVRAGASVTAIGSWAVVQSYQQLWGSIIVLAQVADAVQRALPIARRHQAASSLVIAYDALFISAQAEWEDIYAGRLDTSKIAKARLRLAQQRHDLQAQRFPTGLPRREKLFKLAERDAASYLNATYGVEEAR